jgi:hypothetical protein
MKKSIKTILIILIIILLFFFVFYFLFYKNKKTELPSPSTTASPIPFTLLNFAPPEGEQNIAIDNLALEFQFSKPIDNSSTSVEITPYLDFSLSTNDKKDILYVFPTKSWTFGADYTIKISVRSSENESLPKEIIYKFSPQKPTDSPLDESGLSY